MSLSRLRTALLASTLIGLLPAGAHAQTAATGAPANAAATEQEPASTSPTAPGQISAPAQAAPAAQNEEIVVTGSVFRRKDLDTPSPVTVVSATQLAQRGITTASDAVLSLSSSNGGGLPSSFSANGAFAAGASGVSLRGLTTDSTLVLQDGMRLASYPLADDGARSFVDLNTIPNAVIDRVEVLKDGASATYGADAIAGVVNYIMKKQITGVSATAEGGISQRKDAGHQRLTLTGGYGDLDDQGFNIYASVEYQHDAILYNRDRGFPYNTSDLSSKLADDGKTPDVNGSVYGGGFDPTRGGTNTAVVYPATQATAGDVLSGVPLANGQPMILSPSGCTSGTKLSTAGGGAYCTQDNTNLTSAIQPRQTRFGATSRLTVNLGDHAQAYIMGTYYQNKEFFPSYAGPATTNTLNPISLRTLVLPAVLANGTINPQDPYANIVDPATGQREAALLKYSFGNIPNNQTSTSRTVHITGGVNGDFGDGWHYDVGGSYMHSKVDTTLRGNLNYNALFDAINTGSYNFVDPSANTQAQNDALTPDIHAKATSELWQVQGTITKSILELPGGALQLAASGQVRYEKINDPNQNPLNADGSLSTAGINTFQAQGHRYNESGAFELDAPIFKQLDVNVSGRYDHYSEGFSHFSPKVGVKITPVQPLILRGTFSKGFRAPSIPETQGAVLGFTNITPPQAVVNAHGNDGYVQPYALGLNTAGNPNLKPELSTSFTGGTVLQPTRWLNLSVDFYHIKKKRVIVAGPLTSQAIAAYYDGSALPAGYTVDLNPVDPAHPDATQTIAIVNSPYANAGSLVTSGIDFGASATHRITDGVRFTSSVEATWINKYNIHPGDGTVQHFVGTVGPYAITSASGTPRWKGNWQNTLEAGKATLTATAYYTSGYKGVADDSGAGTTGQCDSAIATTTDADGNAVPERCHVKHFIDVDLVASYAVTDRLTLYTNVLNLFDARAPFDPNTYGGANYNPAWSQAGVIGRYFRIGATVKM